MGPLRATLPRSYYLIQSERNTHECFLHPARSWLATVWLCFWSLLLWVMTHSTLTLYPPNWPGRAAVTKTEPSPHAIIFAGGITDRFLYALSELLRAASSLSTFLVFTLFDLLLMRQNTTAWLIARYLFFIIPYASLILAPMALLVSTLATYAIMARRSEAIAWWAGGQSVYRLAVPGLLFAIALSAGMWLTQEGPLPQANRIQNRLRAQIRGGTALLATPAGRQWLASPDQRRIYTYLYNESSERLSELVVFEFDGEGVYLDNVIIGEGVEWIRRPCLSQGRES